MKYKLIISGTLNLTYVHITLSMLISCKIYIWRSPRGHLVKAGNSFRNFVLSTKKWKGSLLAGWFGCSFYAASQCLGRSKSALLSHWSHWSWGQSASVNTSMGTHWAQPIPSLLLLFLRSLQNSWTSCCLSHCIHPGPAVCVSVEKHTVLPHSFFSFSFKVSPEAYWGS